jgi:hypothetical protein
MEMALEIARLADARGWELSTSIGSVIYWRQRPGQPLGQIDLHRTVVPTNTDGIVGKPELIMMWEAEAIEPLRSLCRKNSHQCYTETYFQPDGSFECLGVFPQRADKGQGLELVLERLGIGWEEVVAIGDNPNDIPMIRKAGVGVAMGNAPDEVKREAKLVAPSNDEEGVAWALEELGFG